MSDSEILFSSKGGVAHVLMNRPQALNALTFGMCVAFRRQLAEWADDPEIGCLVIEGAGDRAFCAGGDIRRLHDEGKAGGSYPRDFYGEEYIGNAAIHHFPKPFIAFMDGIVMGGGVGWSVHGSHRVITQRTLFAMPETGIGLFPDVGGSYFMPRLEGELGIFLALTGTRLKAADSLSAGIGTIHIPHERLPQALEALQAAGPRSGQEVDDVLRGFGVFPGEAELPTRRARIDRHFSGDTIEAILASLDGDADPWAQEMAKALRTKSPTSLKLTFRQMRQGGKLDFDACMRMEWRMVNEVMKGHDFYEGVRAVIIDKDQAPDWQPASLEGVTKAAIDAYFAPRPGDELPVGSAE
ncbi:MAG: enoyl-CoA hydratase/isomerase family protein [Sneathiellaceae bacterium]